VAQVQVVVNNVAQNPSSAYTVSSNTITFTSAPSAGTNNIYVYYTSPITQVIQPGQNTVFPSSLSTTNALYWDTSGNVGIGTSSGTRKLNVYGGATSTRTMTVTSNASEGLEVGVNASNIATVNSAAGGAIIFTQADTERMRIDSSGNVGIGVTPSALAGRLQIFGATGNASAVIGGNANGMSVLNQTGLTVYTNLSGGSTDTTFVAGNTASTYMAFGIHNGTSYSERMRIDSSGNLLVGTTSPTVLGKISSQNGGNAPAGSFHVTNTSSLGTEAITSIKYDNNTTTSNIFVRFYINNGSGGSGTITANGANAAAFGSFSDSRLKENIVDLPSQLSNIMALRPVEYDYIESEGGGHQIGFVAQEVQEIYPDLVGERADGMLTLADMNKNDARLIKCIQEQQALITALTARIEALENK
jgi:hypothetical protein